MNGPLHLGWGAVAGAAALLLVNGALSAWLGLGMERRLLLAGARTVAQLLLLGYLLLPVFRWESPWPVLAMALLMIAVAAREAVRRPSRHYRGAYLHALAALTVSAGATTVVGTALLVGVRPWWAPRYLIPLMGMILGNGLTGVSLGLDRCLRALDEERDRVEALLAFGATAWEAARPVAAEAVRTAMVPILNLMSVVGVVSIPGMMTGQMLGGSPPEQAARYQILIIFLIAAAGASGAVIAVLLALRTVFDETGRLRPERVNLTQG